MVCKSTSSFWACRLFNWKKHLGTRGKSFHELPGPASHSVTSFETQKRGAEIGKKVSGEGPRALWWLSDHPVCIQRSGIQPQHSEQTWAHSQADKTSKDCIKTSFYPIKTIFSPFLGGREVFEQCSWRWGCAGPGCGFDEPCGSLPSQHILQFYLNDMNNINDGNSTCSINCAHKLLVAPKIPVWSTRLGLTSDSRFGNKYWSSPLPGDDNPASFNLDISWKGFCPLISISSIFILVRKAAFSANIASRSIFQWLSWASLNRQSKEGGYFLYHLWKIYAFCVSM